MDELCLSARSALLYGWALSVDWPTPDKRFFVDNQRAVWHNFIGPRGLEAEKKKKKGNEIRPLLLTSVIRWRQNILIMASVDTCLVADQMAYGVKETEKEEHQQVYDDGTNTFFWWAITVTLYTEVYIEHTHHAHPMYLPPTGRPTLSVQGSSLVWGSSMWLCLSSPTMTQCSTSNEVWWPWWWCSFSSGWSTCPTVRLWDHTQPCGDSCCVYSSCMYYCSSSCCFRSVCYHHCDLKLALFN